VIPTTLGVVACAGDQVGGNLVDPARELGCRPAMSATSGDAYAGTQL
jgi:hypothetical protein